MGRLTENPFTESCCDGGEGARAVQDDNGATFWVCPPESKMGPKTQEVRVVDPETGGMKGQKQIQLGAVDPLALMQVGGVAGFGGEKYERYNFAKGYKWSLSFDAMQRHLLAFWNGENNDPESGYPHLAHAAWHCLALLTFSLRGRGTDDRFPA